MEEASAGVAWGESREGEPARVNGHRAALLRRLPPRPKLSRQVGHLLRRLPPRPRLAVERVWLQSFPQWLVALEIGVQQPTVWEMLDVAMAHLRRWAALPLDPVGQQAALIVSQVVPGRAADVLGTWWEKLNESETGRILGLQQPRVCEALQTIGATTAPAGARDFQRLQTGLRQLLEGPSLRWHTQPPARTVTALPFAPSGPTARRLGR